LQPQPTEHGSFFSFLFSFSLSLSLSLTFCLHLKLVGSKAPDRQTTAPDNVLVHVHVLTPPSSLCAVLSSSASSMGCGGQNKTKFLPASFAWSLLLSVTALFFYFP
jgi:hypothetical protein